MPLNNKTIQNLRNFYEKTKKLKARTINVKQTTAANLKNNKKKLSPKRKTTARGRPYLVWNEHKAPSGTVYSIQTVLPGSRKLTRN